MQWRCSALKRQIGSVRERPAGSGRWELRWYVIAEDKYRTKTITAKNDKEARKLLARAMAEYEDSMHHRKPSSITVAELLERYLSDYKTEELRATTRQRYEAIIRNDIIPSLGTIRAERISATDITDFYSWALEHGRKDGKGGLSARTVLHIHNVLHSAFKVAVKRKWVAANPVRDVDAPEPVDAEMQSLNADELVALFELAEGTKYYLPILIGAFTGMRRGEILGLKWDCVDLERKTITVKRSLAELKDGLYLGDTKTISSRRTIPITDTLVSVLREHRKNQDELKHYMAELYSDAGFVCAEDDGMPVKPKNLSTAFKQLIGASGLPRVRFHDLSRHTPASIMLANGENPKIVQERLGHSKSSITLDVYSHVSPRLGREAAERYEQAIRKAAEQRKQNNQ